MAHLIVQYTRVWSVQGLCKLDHAKRARIGHALTFKNLL